MGFTFWSALTCYSWDIWLFAEVHFPWSLSSVPWGSKTPLTYPAFDSATGYNTLASQTEQLSTGKVSQTKAEYSVMPSYSPSPTEIEYSFKLINSQFLGGSSRQQRRPAGSFCQRRIQNLLASQLKWVGSIAIGIVPIVFEFCFLTHPRCYSGRREKS